MLQQYCERIGTTFHLSCDEQVIVETDALIVILFYIKYNICISSPLFSFFVISPPSHCILSLLLKMRYLMLGPYVVLAAPSTVPADQLSNDTVKAMKQAMCEEVLTQIRDREW
jgi:hypothetical protein